MSMEFTEEQISRYSRHILLPEVGGKGQKKIAKAKILLVGAGGLARLPRCIWRPPESGAIGLIDSDVVDLTNLQRQILHHTPDVGRPKVLSGKEKIQALNPDVSVSMYEERLTAGNALKLFQTTTSSSTASTTSPPSFSSTMPVSSPISHLSTAASCASTAA